jgi:phage terminase large subunit-like protein
MSVATLPSASASGRTAARGTRPPDRTTAYARDVVAGRIVAGRLVRLACRRHLEDLAHRKDTGLIWDLSEAERIIDLIGEMPLPDGAPFVVQPSQTFIIGSLFGWYLSDGARRFRTAYIEEGKGNGKTPTAARVGIVGMVADGEHAAEIYTAGVTKDQSYYILRDGRMVVDASPDLRNLIDVGAFALSVPSTNSYMKPVSSEARTLDQKRVHMALIDEIHEHRTSDVVDKMRAGTKGDDRALIFEITNSGYDRNSVCWTHHDYSVKVLSGVVPNDSWFAFVASLDACEKCHAEGAWQPRDGCPNCDDWRDEKVWVKANPLLDVVVTRRYLREQVQEAVDMPTHANLVKRLNFCIWTEASVGAVNMELWDKCNAEPDIPVGAAVYLGLDLSSTTDLTAAMLLYEDGDGWLNVLPYFWCPADRIAMRAKRDKVPYDLWLREGYITATEGNAIDYDSIRRRISGYYIQDGAVKHDTDCLADTYQIDEVCVDPWNATQLAIDLMADGATVARVSQGYAMLSAPTKDWLARIAAGKIRHGGNPVLRWMASNLVVTQDSGGNLKPDKDKSTERIDGQAAAITALARLNGREPEDEVEAAILLGRPW